MLTWLMLVGPVGVVSFPSDVTVCLVAMEMIVFNSIRSDVRVKLLLACCRRCGMRAGG